MISQVKNISFLFCQILSVLIAFINIKLNLLRKYVYTRRMMSINMCGCNIILKSDCDIILQSDCRIILGRDVNSKYNYLVLPLLIKNKNNLSDTQ